MNSQAADDKTLDSIRIFGPQEVKEFDQCHNIFFGNDQNTQSIVSLEYDFRSAGNATEWNFYTNSQYQLEIRQCKDWGAMKSLQGKIDVSVFCSKSWEHCCPIFVQKKNHEKSQPTWYAQSALTKNWVELKSGCNMPGNAERTTQSSTTEGETPTWHC